MPTSVTARIDVWVDEPAELVFSVAVADAVTTSSETLTCVVGDRPVDIVAAGAPVGARLHVVQAPVGRLVLSYAATVTGPPRQTEATPDELILYRRPSRYAESDRLAIIAAKRFDGLAGQELMRGIESWVHSNLYYVPGVSGPTDGAVDAYLAQQGVCRDFAHLVIALARGCGLPARLASAYAPGLTPMDFHAVAEVAVDGIWQVVDATRMAPRQSLVRIATGRDAADTAFLTCHRGKIRFGTVRVTCYADDGLPVDTGDVVHL